MAGLKVLCLFLSAVLVNGSPFFSNNENDLISDLHEGHELHETHEHKTEEPDVYRLSDEVIPQSYELRFVPDLKTFTYVGRVDINVRVKFTTHQIILHSKKLTIKNVRVMRTNLLESSYKFDEPNDLLIIETTQALPYDTEYTVTIQFEGVLNDEMRGFYRSSYINDGQVRWMATTQFEPTYAREAFPCFDEPRFRTPFTVYLARTNGEMTISNMPSEALLPPDTMSGNRVWEKFKQSPPMATYLVAFMVIDQYSYVTDADRKIRVFVKKNAIQQAVYSLKQSTKLLKQLEGYTGTGFKLPKLDVVAVPDFNAGAMENWGLTTYRERYVILNELSSSEQHKTIVTEVTSHEFSHQWFGDLVTPAWWDYLWLNEGFATYFETFGAAAVEPTWNLEQLFVVETVQYALWNEITVQRAMTSRVSKFSQIKGAFDVISYDKAGSVIRMFEHIVSPKTFKNALHEYLKDGVKNYDGTVRPEILFNAFVKSTSYSAPNLPPHTSIFEIMKTWTENIGYPLITIARCYHHGEVTIKQTTYKSPRADKPLPDQKWIVPLTYTTKSELGFSNTQPTYWSFADKPTELPGRFPNSDWILFNLQHSGYYRVNYDLRNWHLLIDQLVQDHEKIHVLNRAQLIEDSSALAHDEKLTFRVHLQLLQYLLNESDMIAWYPAITSLNRLKSETEGCQDYAFVQEYIRNILEKPYEKFGFSIQASDSHVVKIVKPMFLSLACEIGIQNCTQKSTEEYNKNEADLSKVQPDLKKVVYCNALRNSKDQQKVFDNLWNTYIETDISYDKNVILASTSCATDEQVIKKLLAKLIDPKNTEIRKQDVHYITRTFPTQIPTVTAIIKFAIEQIPTMAGTNETNENGVLTVEKLIKSIQHRIKTPQQIQLVKELETKSSSLDQKKHSEFISSIKHLSSSGTKKIETSNKLLKRIKDEYTSKDDKPTTPTQQTTTPHPGSGASALVPKLLWNLAITGVVLCYGAPLLRMLQ